MTPEQIQVIALRCIRRIAPEVDPNEIDPDANLRDQLDIDSMDFLNIVIGIHRETGVEIPEDEYQSLATLNGMVDYVERKLHATEHPAT
jgi:acyl carrier protein